LSIPACIKLCYYPREMMMHMKASHDFGFTSLGDMGEFLARVLVILANYYDVRRSMDTGQCLRPQRVESLVRVILGGGGEKTMEGLDETAREVLEGFTCFSRFVCPGKLMDKDAIGGKYVVGDEGVDGKHVDSKCADSKCADSKCADSKCADSRYTADNKCADSRYTADSRYDRDDESYLTMLNLYYAISLHAALCLPARTEGIDLVIPVVLQSGRLGSINVQVKALNRRLCGSVRREIVRKMKNTYFATRRPSLNICINLSNHKDHVAPTVQDGVVFADGFRNTFHELWQHYPKLLEMVVEFSATGRFRELCQSEVTIRKEEMSAMAATTFFETFPNPTREWG
jgi:hypothetical protein